MRESVECRLGKEFLLLHEIQEIDQDVMELIKSKKTKPFFIFFFNLSIQISYFHFYLLPLQKKKTNKTPTEEALLQYPPINIRPRRAWHLAKASLRCRRRSLRRQKEKQTTTTSGNPVENMPAVASTLTNGAITAIASVAATVAATVAASTSSVPSSAN